MTPLDAAALALAFLLVFLVGVVIGIWLAK